MKQPKLDECTQDWTEEVPVQLGRDDDYEDDDDYDFDEDEDWEEEDEEDEEEY